MVYGTGGLAASNVEFNGLFTDTFATAHEDATKESTQKGWAAGGGAEIKATKHLSVKGEILHADLGDLSMTSTNLTAFTPPIHFPTNVFTHKANLTANVYRFGFNFYF
jgi:outer membrane immunogenic protein